MKTKLLLAIVLFFISTSGYCQKTLTVAFGNALAPWVLPDNNSGIVVDLISAALEPEGYKIVPTYTPYARRINSYQTGLVDVVSDMNINTITTEKLVGFYSDPVYQYQNYLIALAENKFTFNSLEDIGNHSLIAWQGAVGHLAERYKNVVAEKLNYVETHDQALQVKMIFLKRFQVAQMDLHIFKFYRNQLQKDGIIDTRAKVDFFPILGASPNGFLFKDKAIRDTFVMRIKELKASGEYQEIFDKYTATLY